MGQIFFSNQPHFLSISKTGPITAKTIQPRIIFAIIHTTATTGQVSLSASIKIPHGIDALSSRVGIRVTAIKINIDFIKAFSLNG
jgi:hypothetical protein